MKLDRRLLRLLKNERYALAFTIGLGFAGGVLVVLQARFLSRALNGAFLEGLALPELRWTLAALLLVIVLRAIGVWGLEAAAHTVARGVKAGLRRQLFNHLLALGPAHLRNLETEDASSEGGARTGELVNTAVEGIEALDAYFSQYLPQLALAALIPVTYLALVLPIDALSAAVLFVTAPLIPVFMILIGNAAEAVTRKQWSTLSRLSAFFLDVLQGLTTLKILGRSRAQVEIIAIISERYRQTTLGVLRVTFLSALALELVSTLSTAVVAVQIGLRLLYGWVSFEEAFFILVLAPEFYLPLRQLGTRFHAGMAGAAAGKRIFEILESPLPERQTFSGTAANHKEWNEGASSQAGIEQPSRKGPEVTFLNVSYTYPDGREALNGVSLVLPAGQRTALVGASGAGKSTLAQLLLGFIEPQEGQILLDARPLSEIPFESWRRQVAWVPQNPYLFNTSVLENIRMARPEASREQVIEAARLARAHDFIQELPDGYDTVVGERGARLSGGQAQRLALARAFLKDAPMLILDEATSSLDPENEAEIQESIRDLMKGRTVLTIAHRLATVVESDRIYVLEEGQVRQCGTHAELLEQQGPYRNLIKARLERLEGQIGGVAKDRDLAWNGQVEFSRSEVGFEWNGDKSTPGSNDEHSEVISRENLPTHSSQRSGVQGADLRGVFFRLIRIVWPFRFRIGLAALLGFATIASSVGLMSTSAYIIATAALHPSIAVLQVAIVGVRFFGLARGIFRYLERLVSHSVTFQVLSELRIWFYSALEPLAPARLIRYRSGDLLSRVIGDIASLENFYVRALAPPLVAIMCLVGVTVFFSAYSLSTALVLAAFLLTCGALLPVGIRSLGKRPGRRILTAKAELNAAMVDGIQGMADLVAYGQEMRQAEIVSQAGLELAAAQRKMAHLNGLQSAAGGLLANLGMWSVLFLGIPLVAEGNLTGVDLAVLSLAALTSFEAVLPIPQAAQHLESNLQAARRLFQLVDAVPAVKEPEVPLQMPEQVWLEIEGLSFRYPEGSDREKPALADIGLSLPPGKRVAIVGPSGAGKSTLVNLLLRFWEYVGAGNAGRICLNGQDLNRYPSDELRSKMAVVSQNTYLFNATLKENLLIARPSATREAIDRAIEGAQLTDLVRKLPHGLETWLGEGGLRLSAGERQRVAIARALLRDAPLLVLDEATANLDTLTERQVLSSIHTLMEGRSTLMITHRLVGMEWMDEILVLRAGRVIERGVHQDLIQARGWYARIWKQQNSLLQKVN